MDRNDFPWRPLGALLVDKGLLSAPELERALDEQGRSGRLLGQILVEGGYVTGLSLAQALAEQHGVQLRPTSGSTSPDPSGTSSPGEAGRPESQDRAWRPLGTLLVSKGFVSEAELEDALAEQERNHRRLGEILVESGRLSGAALALALGEQHGLELGSEEELAAGLQTVITPSTPDEPSYRVYEVVYGGAQRPGSALYETTNFLEAADFACEFVQDQKPHGLEIRRAHGHASETVWTYSETRAAEEATARKSMVETFGYDPVRWNTRSRFDSETKRP